MIPNDRLSRPLRDLRISVTDRCNLRCGYCMPREVFGPDFVFLERKELLTFEEIARLVRALVSLGVQKVRITGGEPLVRREITGLVGALSALPGVDDLAMTTNGLLLARHAGDLKAAGLQRLTVSLDSLVQDVYSRMTGLNARVRDVLKGIETAEQAGFESIKVNCVVRRGLNDDGIVDLARHFRSSGHIVRFIEYMDVGNTNGWRLEEVVSGEEIRRRIHREFPLEPVPPNYPGEVARRWRYADGAGEIGIVTSVTRPFCGSCTRARLSPEGKLYTCLFAGAGFDLRHPLRQEKASDEALSEMVARIWEERADRYSELRSSRTTDWPKIEMSYIGG